MKTPEAKAKFSEKIKAKWADPEYRRKRLESFHKTISARK